MKTLDRIFKLLGNSKIFKQRSNTVISLSLSSTVVEENCKNWKVGGGGYKKEQNARFSFIAQFIFIFVVHVCEEWQERYFVLLGNVLFYFTSVFEAEKFKWKFFSNFDANENLPQLMTIFQHCSKSSFCRGYIRIAVKNAKIPISCEIGEDKKQFTVQYGNRKFLLKGSKLNCFFFCFVFFFLRKQCSS